MSASRGFDIVDIVTSMRECRSGGDDTEEPKVEQLIVKLRKIQQVNQALEEDVKKAQSIKDSLQEELSTLQSEAYRVEETYKQNQEAYKVLQFQCEEVEQEAARQLQLNQSSEDVVQQYRTQIQEVKHKHTQQRMQFENQLEQLIEQHKKLHSVCTLKRLPAEIENADDVEVALATEQLKLTQLRHLEEEVETVKRQKEQEAAADETQETVY